MNTFFMQLNVKLGYKSFEDLISGAAVFILV